MSSRNPDSPMDLTPFTPAPGRERTSIRLGLPSKGRMEGESFAFLESCGLKVTKHHPRQYVASIRAIPEVEVWLQRSADIVHKVCYGNVDLGITGFDSVQEYVDEDHGLMVLHDSLGFGGCQLVLAVPDIWEDITSMQNLSRLAAERGAAGHPLRIATKYQRLTREFLDRHHASPYQLIAAEGAMEAGPHMGYVDMIADLTATGTTLRENHLRPLEDGTILESEACLIGNRAALKNRPEVLAVAKQLLEFFDAHLRAANFHNIIANIHGESPEAVAQQVLSQPDLRGLQGPTISPVYLSDPNNREWFAISLVVRQERLVQAVEQLRGIGASGVVVLPATYIFEDEPSTYHRLIRELKGEDS
jgi:ATP phosphoribosyltransferase